MAGAGVIEIEVDKIHGDVGIICKLDLFKTSFISNQY